MVAKEESTVVCATVEDAAAVTSAVPGETDDGAGGTGNKRGAALDAEPPPAKQARLLASRAAGKEPRKEEPVPGHRKFVLSGLKGIKQEVLQGQIDRAGIPYNKMRKARVEDSGEIWLKEDAVFLKGCRCVLSGMKVKGLELHLAPAPTEPEGAASEGAARHTETGGFEVSGRRTLSQQVTPLCDLEYEEQIAFKRHLLLGSLEKVTKKLLLDAKDGSGVEWTRALARGPVCPLETVHHSPESRGYRNKNEFTIGLGSDGRPLVGFRFGRFIDGNTTVGCADGVLHTPEEALGVARCITEFLREHTALGVWTPHNHQGVWRVVMVRHNSAGAVMVLVQYASTNCTQEALAEALASLQAFLLRKKAEGAIKLTSLYFQEHNMAGNRANDDSTIRLAWGEESFTESILGLSFRVSPSAFFQVNTRGAELLYRLVRDWAAADKNELILDVCCGTGTIGLCMSRGARKVIGLEICADAVKDAQANALENKVTNCEFEVGRAEDTIPRVCAAHLASGQIEGQDDLQDGEGGCLGAGAVERFGSCVAVLDPPREGVHWKVIKALRASKEIERIVYISCNHTAWVDQARALCCPTDDFRTPGEPFRPIKAHGVDLFPHTSHVELVVLFERGECLKRTLAARTDKDAETVPIRCKEGAV